MTNEESWNELCWYLIRTHPKQEDRTEQNLRACNVETLMPRFKERRYNKFTNEPVQVVKPLFPSYVFARFKLIDLYHKVKYMRGVRDMVSFDGYPTIVDDSVIALIRSRMGGKGMVNLSEQFAVGDEVVIKAGPLKNFTGVFEHEMKDADRVMILLQAVNYQAHIVVDKNLVQKASQAVNAQ
jgi:transcriptional antiterminator RfaH